MPFLAWRRCRQDRTRHGPGWCTILPDELSAFVAAQAITAALLARPRSGEGQHVRLSLQRAVVTFLRGSDIMRYWEEWLSMSLKGRFN